MILAHRTLATPKSLCALFTILLAGALWLSAPGRLIAQSASTASPPGAAAISGGAPAISGKNASDAHTSGISFEFDLIRDILLGRLKLSPDNPYLQDALKDGLLDINDTINAIRKAMTPTPTPSIRPTASPASTTTALPTKTPGPTATSTNPTATPALPTRTAVPTASRTAIPTASRTAGPTATRTAVPTITQTPGQPPPPKHPGQPPRGQPLRRQLRQRLA